MKDFKLLINGRLTPGASSIDVINPATEEVVAVCPTASEAQLNEAVAAAKAAFPAWSKRPLKERAALLNKLADALMARQEEFARLLTQERPVLDTPIDIGVDTRRLHFFDLDAGLAIFG